MGFVQVERKGYGRIGHSQEGFKSDAMEKATVERATLEVEDIENDILPQATRRKGGPAGWRCTRDGASRAGVLRFECAASHESSVCKQKSDLEKRAKDE